MPLHQQIEKCVEYVAYTGFLGCEPSALQQFLAKDDPSIDAAYFTHLYKLLIDNPAIQIILTDHPIPAQDGTLSVGSAPLPSDYIASARVDVDLGRIIQEGARGRNLAYQIQGETPRTSREVILEKRARNEEKRKTNKAKPGIAELIADPSGTPAEAQGSSVSKEVFRVLTQDDGDGVPVLDLPVLTEKWGSRLRIKATDDEIYLRLTGFHTKNSKITPPVFQVLQIAAQSREKGITAIELGSLINVSQGSIHYYMKVLTGLGLCAKIPAIIHASITNMLVFHRFLSQNANYRSLAYREAAPAPIDDNGPEDELAEVDDDGSAAQEVSQAAHEWGLNFGPLNEADLSAGIIIKERLVQLLDHPLLENHLLRYKNVLLLIGWQGSYMMRHRRSLQRIIDSMIIDGIVERVTLGVGLVCLRLTKYNPDFDAASVGKMPGEVTDDTFWMQGQNLTLDPQLFAQPYMSAAGAAMTVPLDHQAISMVVEAGSAGITLADIRDRMNGFFRRALEHHIVRAETSLPLPHLGALAICSIMETYGRERRARAFAIAAYRQLMVSQNLPVDEAKHPLPSLEAGQWANIKFRRFFKSPQEFFSFAESISMGGVEDEVKVLKVKGRPKKSGSTSVRPSKDKSASVDGTGAIDPTAEDGAESSSSSTGSNGIITKRRRMKYANDAQNRGRPRKYVHVVEEDGTPNRRIIGTIYSTPDLPPILIYVRLADKIVEPPGGYDGRGAPPPVTAEQLKSGHAPKWYWKFPTHDAAIGNGAKKAKKIVKKRGSPRKRKVPKKDLIESEGVRKSSRPKSKLGPVVDSKDVDQLEDENEEMAMEMDEEEDGDLGIPGPSTIAGRRLSTQGPDDQGSDAGVPIALQAEDDNELPSIPIDDADRPQIDALLAALAAVGNSTEQSGPLHADHGEDTMDSSRQDNGEALAQSASLRNPKRKRKGVLADPLTNSANDVAAKSPKKQKTKPKTRPVSDTHTSSSHAASVTPQPDQPTTRDISTQRLSSPATLENVHMRNKSSLPVHVNQKDNRGDSETWSRRRDTDNTPPGDQAKAIDVDSAVHTGSENAPVSAVKPKKRGKRHEHATANLDPASTTMPPAHLEVAPAFPEGFPPSADTNISPRESQRMLAVEADSKHTARPEVQAAPNIRNNSNDFPAETQIQATGSAPPKNAAGKPVNGGAAKSKRAGTGRPIAETVNNKRVDFGQYQRLGEVAAALQDAGGVHTELKLSHHHSAWTHRVAGTETSNAPLVGYSMDRSIFRRCIKTLLDDGRIKETDAVIPTSTGRWTTVKILYLADKPMEEVQTYIRGISNATQNILAPKHTAKREQLQKFTEIRMPNLTGAFNARGDASNTSPAGESIVNRRSVLLRELNVIGALYGYKSGRCMRLELLHRAITATIESSVDATSVVSKFPRIISIPFLFEELTLGDWVHCVSQSHYDPDLERLTQTEEGRATKLKNVPKRMQPPGGWGGHSLKSKLATLLNFLIEMRAVTPLIPAMEVSGATITVEKPLHGHPGAFCAPPDAIAAMYFQVYEFIPVYHIASEPSPLLGILPVRDTRELDVYWSTVKIACLEADPQKVPRLDPVPHMGPPQTAALDPTLEIKRTNIAMLRSAVRWMHTLRLLPIQRGALDETVDWKTGEQLITEDEDIRRLAYDNALPYEWTHNAIRERRDLVERKAANRKRRMEEAEAQQRARQQRAQNSLKTKVALRQAQNKQEWEDRVRASAERIGLDFEPELVDFISRQTLLSTTVASRGRDISDKTMDSYSKLYTRSKELGEDAKSIGPPRFQRRPAVSNQEKAGGKVLNRPTAGAKSGKGVRRRKVWTPEDDELVIDCEAIIRSRALDRKGNLGRNAMTQVITDIGLVAIHNHIKRLLASPGKQAYFERLVDAWHDIWIMYRGTDELPDPDPNSMTDFDLIKHLEFFRLKIVKSNVRLSAASGFTYERARIRDLPTSPAKFLEEQSWTYPPPEEHSLEAFCQGFVEETRYGSVVAIPFEQDRGDLPHGAGPGRSSGRIRAILKMIVATTESRYDSVVADTIFDQPPYLVEDEVSALEEEGVLERIRQSHVNSTGRQLQYRTSWHQLHDGLLTEELQSEVSTLSNSFAQADDGLDWPVLGTSGDIALLMEMVSDHQVDFEFDLNESPSLGHHRDTYNTRRLNDDAFEFSLKVTCKASEAPASPELPSTVASRRLASWPKSNVQYEGIEDMIEKVISIVEAVGEAGISKPELVDATGYGKSTLDSVLARLASAAHDAVFWAGYDTARLVHSSYLAAWTVKTCTRELDEEGKLDQEKSQERITLPRRWTDMWGDRIQWEWDRCVRVVLGQIITRPGLTERRMREKLRVFVDRLELNDVLQYLLEKGAAKRIGIALGDRVLAPIEATDLCEEGEIVWLPDSRGLWR